MLKIGLKIIKDQHKPFYVPINMPVTYDLIDKCIIHHA